MSKPEMMEYIRRKLRPCGGKKIGLRAEFVRGENSVAIDAEPWVVVMARRVLWARKILAHAADYGPRTVARAALYLAEAKHA